METTVKSVVDARKDAFSNGYILTDEIEKKIDELFVQIYQFAEQFKDPMEFETAFASSELNDKYVKLFTRVTQNCTPKSYGDTNEVEQKTKGQRVAEEINSDMKYLADDITMPARRKAREEMDSKLRDTPLGKIEQASNMASLFKRFTYKFKKNKNVDQEEKNDEQN